MKAGEIYDGIIVDVARELIRPASTVLDVGACFGQMAVLFSRYAGPHGAVETFEANPLAAALVRLNLAANGADNATVHETAVWHRDDDALVFPVPDWTLRGSAGSFWVEPAARCQRPAWPVTTTTIDSLEFAGPVSFMKVDVQGSDLNAMRGARQTILRHRMPVVFEYEEKFGPLFGQSFDDYMAFLDDVGYRVERVLAPNNFLATPRPAP